LECQWTFHWSGSLKTIPREKEEVSKNQCTMEAVNHLLCPTYVKLEVIWLKARKEAI
jgi:hypothetical protein